MTRMKPLAGMLVVDLTRYLPGPFASRELLRYGARVVRLESPDGDPLRDQSSTVRRRPGILVHVHPGHLPRMVGRLATTTIAEKGSRMDILLRLHS